MTIEQTFTTPENTHVTAPAVKWGRVVKLMKPITWFGASWAFLCGAIASGATEWSFPIAGQLFLGMLMAGPILTGFSQVINDYFDRGVDAINEPDRPIPSGDVTLPQVAAMTLLLAGAGMAISRFFGIGVFLLASCGFILAVFYSAPPTRAKRNGWVGNGMVAISYEGLAWLAGHLVFAALTPGSVMIALLYSFGTHGIMSINDYKSIEGDRQSGINTIPVLLGEQHAAWLITGFMNLAQIGVIALFVAWDMYIITAILVVLLLAQLPGQRGFLKDPAENYLKFSAIGVNFFVWGMMVAAIGLRMM
ncbi:MAG: chlorophyll synthase ChlG [Chloroflexota bacterium]